MNQVIYKLKYFQKFIIPCFLYKQRVSVFMSMPRPRSIYVVSM